MFLKGHDVLEIRWVHTCQSFGVVVNFEFSFGHGIQFFLNKKKCTCFTQIEFKTNFETLRYTQDL